jgi:diguanylate cyclase (GGDEF)-like protein/PAS domain S-box-containing protein
MTATRSTPERHSGGSELLVLRAAGEPLGPLDTAPSADVRGRTERRAVTEGELRKSHEQFRSVLANIPGVVYRCECDEPWTQHFMSNYIQVLTGYPASDFTTSGLRSFGSIIHIDDRERVRQAVEDARSTGAPYSIDYRVMHADGTPRWIADHGRVVSDHGGRPLWIDGVFLDLSRQKDAEEHRDRAEKLLRHQTLHDALTGLPNRTLIFDRAEQMLLRCKRDHRPVGAFFADLDNFKTVNDSLGHNAGDELLKAVAVRLGGVLRESDTVGRLGGDEFVVLAEGLSLAAGPGMVAERLRDTLREPFLLRGFEETPVSVSTTIGIATGDRESAHDLLRDADIALYRGKSLGKNCYVLFQAGMKSAAMTTTFSPETSCPQDVSPISCTSGVAANPAGKSA